MIDEEMRLMLNQKRTLSIKTSIQTLSAGRAAALASARTAQLSLCPCLLVLKLKDKGQKEERSKTHGAGLAGDVWAKRKKRMRIANRYEFPSDRRQKLESENSSAAVGVLSLSIGSQSKNRKRRLFDSRRNRAFSR
jgi:hypothetical protein